MKMARVIPMASSKITNVLSPPFTKFLIFLLSSETFLIATLFWFVAKYKVAADTSFFSELLTPIGAAAVRCTFFATKEIKIHMKSISISGELMTRFVCHRSFAPAISRFVGG
uniref:AlNc14C16G1777 protein n=1 Tax=Albugo laibachii Nc14 TaxID=890382 RepID=F0W4A5_9STRA|nr:AlNc14C16G1777 [Albugo laibachii Nc14]|eukprot:CCA15938.1 AlNc14C16G1777 [Albugo laibachii Nc14]